jgi:hypothetical protein
VRFADRKQGEEIPLELRGRVLRSAIMIVAQRFKRDIGDRRPYVRRLAQLKIGGYETIYLVGNAERDNAQFVDAIAKEFVEQSGWRIVDRRTYRARLNTDSGFRRVETLLVTLRTPRDSDEISVLDEIAPADDLPVEDRAEPAA